MKIGFMRSSLLFVLLLFAAGLLTATPASADPENGKDQKSLAYDYVTSLYRHGGLYTVRYFLHRETSHGRSGELNIGVILEILTGEIDFSDAIQQAEAANAPPPAPTGQ